ncbi:MAG: response regulator [Planctomycetes bacterium]|nr:response regulator [Planctomycetota bacterium]
MINLLESFSFMLYTHSTSKMRTANILVVDDDSEFILIVSDMLKEGLPDLSIKITSASSISDAIKYIKDNEYDLFIFDYKLTDASGLGLLQIVKNQCIKTPAIIITAFGDEDTAIRAFKSGATDYIPKRKLNTNTLTKSIKSALQLNK